MGKSKNLKNQVVNHKIDTEKQRVNIEYKNGLNTSIQFKDIVSVSYKQLKGKPTTKIKDHKFFWPGYILLVPSILMFQYEGVLTYVGVLSLTISVICIFMGQKIVNTDTDVVFIETSGSEIFEYETSVGQGEIDRDRIQNVNSNT
ncbi:MAG: YolD-like family protein [Saprospiraceae bacterium]|nr:YolD-like family protein [Saprospiraceae bacterium]